MATSKQQELVPGPERYDPCPCGRGNKGKFCCWTPRGWFKKPIPRLGREDHPETTQVGCYAAPLGSCGGGISREHYFSRSMLSQLEDVRFYGLPGVPEGESRSFGIESMTAKVLCAWHNSALSPLDVELGRLLSTFRLITEGTSAHDREGFVLFSGADVERGLLKVMMSWMASGFAPDRGGRIRIDGTYDRNILELLYHGRPVGNGSGLYLTEPNSGEFRTNIVSFEPYVVRAGEGAASIIGLGIGFNGFTFAFFLQEPHFLRLKRFRDYFFRPRQVWVTTGPSRKVIEFTWSTRRTSVLEIGTV